MSSNQVVLYFENPEDAVRFTLAAGSVLSEDVPNRNVEELAKVAREMGRATRITTNGSIKDKD
jgi:hypothetical protein